MKSYRGAQKYGFINARIRGIMSRFLSVDDYEALLQSKDYDDFIRILRQTYYGGLIEAAKNRVPSPETLAVLLARDFADVIITLSKTVPGQVSEFIETYKDYFLAESLKTIIRGVHAGLDSEQILRYAVPTSPAQEVLFEDLAKAQSVLSIISQIPKNDLRDSIKEQLPYYEEYNSTAPLEVAMEEWYLKNILEVLEDFSEDDRKRVLGILEARVDLHNLLSALRARVLSLGPEIIEISMVRFTEDSRKLANSLQQKSSWKEVFEALENTSYSRLADRLAREYEKSKNLLQIELAIEDYIAQLVKRQMTIYPFHLGTVIGFFNLKFYEVKNIRSIAVGIERGEPASTIREMITIW